MVVKSLSWRASAQAWEWRYSTKIPTSRAGTTEASFKCRSTIYGVTNKSAAIASTCRAFSRKTAKADNWSMKRKATRGMFSATSHTQPNNFSHGPPLDAVDRRGLGQSLLLHAARQRLKAATAGKKCGGASPAAAGIKHRPDVQVLQEPASGDVLGQFVDQSAGLDAPHVKLSKYKLFEEGVLREGQNHVLGKFRHPIFSPTAAQGHSAALNHRNSETPNLFLRNVRWLPRTELTGVKS